MRSVATILIVSALAALSWIAFSQQDLGIAIASGLLALLWGVAIVLHAPRTLHTAGLAIAAALCAVCVGLKMSVVIPILSLSAILYGWDLLLMDHRLSIHPRKTTNRLSRKYVVRAVGLSLTGAAATLLTRSLRIHLSFFTAFVLSCVCGALFLLIHRRIRKFMNPEPAQQQNEADG